MRVDAAGRAVASSARGAADELAPTTGLAFEGQSRFADILNALLRFEVQRAHPKLATPECPAAAATVIQTVDQFSVIHDPEYQPVFGPRRKQAMETLLAMLARESAFGSFA